MKKEVRETLEATKPEGALFLAESGRLRRTIAGITSWMNQNKGGSLVSRPFTDQARALRLSNVNFDRSPEAAKLWEDLCLKMSDEYAPPGHYFDIIGEPSGALAWYGWVRETAEATQ